MLKHIKKHTEAWTVKLYSSLLKLLVSFMSMHAWRHLCCYAWQEAKQLEEARLKLAKEQKKRQEMEGAARLAAQRKAAEQAARQQAEAEMQQKRADRQSRVSPL